MKKDKYILLFLASAVLILWQTLLAGYILSLDMIFVPEMKIMTNADSFLNFLPVAYLIYWFTFIIPAWLVQKLILIILFFNIGYLAFKYLPVGENKTIQIFSSLIYMVNPFVYTRFLAGHWPLLMAYAFLPLFFHYLFLFEEKNDLKLGLKLFGTLFLISLFSVHIFIIALLVLVIWYFYHFIKCLVVNKEKAKKILKNGVICGVLFLIVSSYWLVPALNHSSSIEQRFGVSHWQAFAASNHGEINATLNVLSLNGFWGESQPWSNQFAWPQDYLIFWLTFIIILLLVVIGIIYGFRNKKLKSVVIFFVILGILAFIFSTGAGETIFKNFNIWLYENISFWSGFRDSQKFSSFLALSYAVLSGFGVMAIVDYLDKKKININNYKPLIFLIPVLFGFLMWGGLHKQIKPIWYPEVWTEAKKIIQADTTDYKVLFLPWHGYLSLNFNNNLLVANPARVFFGEKAIVSQSVELEGIYDQELSREYRKLDEIIKGDLALSPNEVIDFLVKQNLKYIVYFQDLNSMDNLKYEFLNHPNLKEIISDKQLMMYKVEI